MLGQKSIYETFLLSTPTMWYDHEHLFLRNNETISSVFRGFFSEGNFDDNPSQITKDLSARYPYIGKILCTAGSNILQV